MRYGWIANVAAVQNQAHGGQAKVTLFLLAENILGERAAWGQRPQASYSLAQTFFGFAVEHQSAVRFKRKANFVTHFAAFIATFLNDQTFAVFGT